MSQPIVNTGLPPGTIPADGQVIDTLTPKKGKNRDNDPARRAEPAWDRKTSQELKCQAATED